MNKKDFTFGGWYADSKFSGEAVSFPYTVTGDITLYAKWNQIPGITYYTVDFDANGGEPAPEEQTVAEGGTASEPSEEPVKKIPTAAGLYEGSPDTTTTAVFKGWYKGDIFWDFALDTVTSDITLTAQWGEHTRIDLSGQTGDNIVTRAANYITTIGTADEYTLLLDEDVECGPQTLNMANSKLTIIGLDEERTIQYNGANNGRLFFLNNANARLTLGNHITLKGIATSSANLVRIENGIFTMQAGSKITGNTTSGNGMVYIAGEDSGFIMEGGEVSGNKVTYPLVEVGCVYVSNGATFTMSGGSISDNTWGSSNRPADVQAASSAGALYLSGNSAIGAVYVSAPSSAGALYLSGMAAIIIRLSLLPSTYRPMWNTGWTKLCLKPPMGTH